MIVYGFDFPSSPEYDLKDLSHSFSQFTIPENPESFLTLYGNWKQELEIILNYFGMLVYSRSYWNKFYVKSSVSIKPSPFAILGGLLKGAV